MKKILTFIFCCLALMFIGVATQELKAADVDLVANDLNLINFNSTMKSNFPVPTKSANGTTITYSTTTPSVLDLTYVESDGWVLVNRNAAEDLNGELTVKVALNGVEDSKTVQITVPRGTTLYREYAIRYANIESTDGYLEKYNVGCYNQLPELTQDNYIFKGWKFEGIEGTPFKYVPFGTSGDIVLEPVFEEDFIVDLEVEINAGTETLEVTALDSFNDDLITVTAVYASGQIKPLEMYSFEFYNETKDFRFGDEKFKVFVHTNDSEISKDVPLTVKKAVIQSDKLPGSSTFNQSYPFTGEYMQYNLIPYQEGFSFEYTNNKGTSSYYSFAVSFKNDVGYERLDVGTSNVSLLLKSETTDFEDIEINATMEITKTTITADSYYALITNGRKTENGYELYHGETPKFDHNFKIENLRLEDEDIKKFLETCPPTNQPEYIIIKDGYYNYLGELIPGNYKVEATINETNYILRSTVDFKVVEKPIVIPYLDGFNIDEIYYGDILPTIENFIFKDNLGNPIEVDTKTLGFQDIDGNTIDVIPTNAGYYRFVISWESEVYGNGEITINFDIKPLDVSKISIEKTNFPSEATYTGSKIEISPTLTYNDVQLILGQDYQLYFDNDPINVGKYKITIQYIGNYSGFEEIDFVISALNISDNPLITIECNENLVYTGEELEPSFDIKNGDMLLNFITDYTVEYLNNINAGTLTIIIHGNENYIGYKSFDLTINQATITKDMISSIEESYIYTGSAITPEFTITFNNRILVADTDYTVEYLNNTEVSTLENKAVINITGMNNFKDEIISIEFTITSVDSVFESAKVEVLSILPESLIIEDALLRNFPVELNGVKLSYTPNVVGPFEINNTTGEATITHYEEDKEVVVTVTMQYENMADYFDFTITVKAKAQLVEVFPENLAFTGITSSSQSSDTYWAANYSTWTIEAGKKLGAGYSGGYSGFGKSDSPISITSPKITTDKAFTITIVIKGNGTTSNTTYLNFDLLDENGTVVAVGHVKSNNNNPTNVGETNILPTNSKDSTVEIEFALVDEKTMLDVSNLKISFTKGTGNIGFKSLVWNKQ